MEGFGLAQKPLFWEQSRTMRIAVIGTGYVGLVAGACFADTGNQVYCVDIDPNKVDSLKRGEIPIFEPGLDTLVRRGIQEGRLKFTTSTPEAVQACEIVFIAVGTPPLPSGEPDLRFLQTAAEEIGSSMPGPRIVVNKSTVPVGSHRWVTEWIQAHTNYPVEVVSNPEFLKEGSAVDDFLRPDRVVIGTEKQEVYEKMAALYAPFVRQGNPVLWMDPTSAEVTKYACNSFLATRISFMNEMARLCEKVGADVEEVRRGMSTDVRIGKHFLYAGVGYGGSCFPKDVQALLSTSRREGVRLGVIEAAEEANALQKRYLVDRIRARLGKNLNGKVFGVWGLAFKPNTDDMREAPALTIIDELLLSGAKVRVFDPVAMPNARKILGQRVEFCQNALDAADGVDALILATEWNEFRHIDFDALKSRMRSAVIYDGRNLWNPEEIRELGFEYSGIGRP
jgi:UDPglucose 6-dehydrogenase